MGIVNVSSPVLLFIEEKEVLGYHWRTFFFSFSFGSVLNVFPHWRDCWFPRFSLQYVTSRYSNLLSGVHSASFLLLSPPPPLSLSARAKYIFSCNKQTKKTKNKKQKQKLKLKLKLKQKKNAFDVIASVKPIRVADRIESTRRIVPQWWETIRWMNNPAAAASLLSF